MPNVTAGYGRFYDSNITTCLKRYIFIKLCNHIWLRQFSFSLCFYSVYYFFGCHISYLISYTWKWVLYFVLLCHSKLLYHNIHVMCAYTLTVFLFTAYAKFSCIIEAKRCTFYHHRHRKLLSKFQFSKID